MVPRAAVLALLVCALSACGGNPLAAAVSKTSGTDGVRISMVSEIQSPATGRMRFTGSGAIDMSGRRLHMRMRVPLPLRALVPGGLEIEQIMDRTVLYTRDGERWTSAETAGRLPGLDVGQLMQGGSGDPAAIVAWLKAGDDVREVGREEVRGVQTVRYRASVGLDELGDGTERLRELGMGDSLPIEVWVSGDELVRRVRYGWNQDVPGVGRTRMTVRFELFDYGKRVTIPRAPRSQA